MDNVTEMKDATTPSTHLILATTTANITVVNNNNNNDSINNNNSVNIDTQLLQIQQQQQQQQQQHQLQHQQIHPLYVTSRDYNETDNFLTTTGTTTATVASATTTNFVAIPLSERQPIICISQNGNNNNNNNHQTHQHPSHHQHHENYSNTSLTRSKSCLVRWRQCCLNFFTKIMGSNNPSEADRYEYYDY